MNISSIISCDFHVYVPLSCPCLNLAVISEGERLPLAGKDRVVVKERFILYVKWETLLLPYGKGESPAQESIQLASAWFRALVCTLCSLPPPRLFVLAYRQVYRLQSLSVSNSLSEGFSSQSGIVCWLPFLRCLSVRFHSMFQNLTESF